MTNSRPELVPEKAPLPRPPASRRPWELAAAGLLLLHLSNPLFWGKALPVWWFPPVGIGFVLVAWLGPRAVLLLAANVLLVTLQAQLSHTQTVWGTEWKALRGGVVEAVILSAEVLVAWGCYHRLARGSRRLGDPRSAMLFLILVPTLTVGAFASLLGVAAWRLNGMSDSLLRWISLYWLSHALGILVLAPPLLVNLTPWLVRHRFARPDDSSRDADEADSRRLGWKDCTEIGLLAWFLAVLSLIQAHLSADPESAGWQLWGLSMLVIVWASLRHGLRGGTIVAAASVGTPLLVGLIDQAANENPFMEFEFLKPVLPVLQANLLAECSTALLAAAAANWIRLGEARYRQVVTRIPVVLYSARVAERLPGRRLPRVEITFVSPAARDIFGADPAALLGDHSAWLGHVLTEDREVLFAALAQLARGGGTVTCEYRLLPPGSVGEAARPPANVPTPADGIRELAPEGFEAPPRWVRDTLAPRYGPTDELEGWDGVLSDITEQRTLADDLRRTTSMFHALVANLPAGVFFVQGEAGMPILVNARARQLLGRREDPSAGLGRLVEAYCLSRPDGTPYPTDELPVAAALHKGVTGMRDDIVVQRPDGRALPLIAWAAPIDLGGAGRQDAAVWVFEDLSTLRQAEAARRESEARLRTIIETMAEGLIVLDESARILECNPAACAILDRDADRLRGRPFLDPEWPCVTEDGAPLSPDRRPAARGLRDGAPVRNVIVGIPGKGDAGRRWLLINVMPLAVPRPQQKAARVVVTFADVTDHRRALEVVRASEEKYRELVETLPIALVQFDAAGALVYMNPAARAATGYGPEELREGGGWDTIAHPEDLPKVREAVVRALGGRTERLELRYRAKDGAEKVGYVLVEPRQQDGGVAGFTALVVDMTRERQLEADLQRAQRLELIGRLASGIAHDFNNLLTVVLTLAELARTSLPEDHPTRDDLRRITYAGEQAANLAHQLLAFSKKRQVTPQRIDVNRVAQRTLELLRATLPRVIHIEPALSGVDLPVQADEMQLQQVLMNLCLNARDAMPGGGRLEVRTDRVSGDGQGTGEWVRLSVQDNGEGIPQELQGRIFDAFFSTKERGTGLGLAMVKQIVEGFGGRVEVSSQPGEGARFDVWLPREADGQPTHDPGSSGTGRRSGEVGSMPT